MWANCELQKDYSERHPILQWYKNLCDFQRAHATENKEIHTADSSGPVYAYLSLSYDLYVLRHHSHLQQKLINRIKDKKQFQGARYEVYVASSFIKAGFDIKFEDESDRSTSHCEFLATNKISNSKYSVEAKSRHRKGVLGQEGSKKLSEEPRLRVGTLLRKALQKEALHQRVVFVDINMPPEEGGVTTKRWTSSLMKEISLVESDTIDGKLSPPAYLFFTNHPYHYVGNEVLVLNRDLLLTAINIPEFIINNTENISIKHRDILLLWKSINIHHNVPMYFDE